MWFPEFNIPIKTLIKKNYTISTKQPHGYNRFDLQANYIFCSWQLQRSDLRQIKGFSNKLFCSKSKLSYLENIE